MRLWTCVQVRLSRIWVTHTSFLRSTKKSDVMTRDTQMASEQYFYLSGYFVFNLGAMTFCIYYTSSTFIGMDNMHTTQQNTLKPFVQLSTQALTGHVKWFLHFKSIFMHFTHMTAVIVIANWFLNTSRTRMTYISRAFYCTGPQHHLCNKNTKMGCGARKIENSCW